MSPRGAEAVELLAVFGCDDDVGDTGSRERRRDAANAMRIRIADVEAAVGSDGEAERILDSACKAGPPSPLVPSALARDSDDGAVRPQFAHTAALALGKVGATVGRGREIDPGGEVEIRGQCRDTFRRRPTRRRRRS